jgi:hypothetical protein
MTTLQPLLSRDRYSDPEWELASAGKCNWDIANYPHITRCGKPSDPNSFYRWCTEHDQESRYYDPQSYGR